MLMMGCGLCLFVSENRGHSDRKRGNHCHHDRQNRDIWGNPWMVQARYPLRRKGKSVSVTKMCAWNRKEKSSLFLVLLYCVIFYPVEVQRVWYQDIRQQFVQPRRHFCFFGLVTHFFPLQTRNIPRSLIKDAVNIVRKKNNKHTIERTTRNKSGLHSQWEFILTPETFNVLSFTQECNRLVNS